MNFYGTLSSLDPDACILFIRLSAPSHARPPLDHFQTAEQQLTSKFLADRRTV